MKPKTISSHKYPLIAIVVIIFIIITVLNLQKPASIKRTVTTQRTSADQINQAKLQQQISALKQAGVISENIASSKADVCYVKSIGSLLGGFFRGDWKQICYLRYIEGFTTKLNREQTIVALRSAPRAEKLFGSESGYSCGLYGSLESMDIITFIPARNRTYVNPDDARLYASCNPPDQLEYAFSYKGNLIVFLDESATAKVYKSFDPKIATGSKDQIWLTLEEDYYNESLTCLTVICTSAPRKNPITAEPLSERKTLF